MSFKNFVRSFDSFGEKVTLNYNGDAAFRTMIGALFSILIKVFLLIYSVQQIIQLINYEDPQVTIVSLPS